MLPVPAEHVAATSRRPAERVVAAGDLDGVAREMEDLQPLDRVPIGGDAQPVLAPENALPFRITPALDASIVTLPALRSGSWPPVTWMVAGLPGEKTPGLKVITVPLAASAKHWRSEPAPMSAVLVTVQVAAGRSAAAASVVRMAFSRGRGRCDRRSQGQRQHAHQRQTRQNIGSGVHGSPPALEMPTGKRSRSRLYGVLPILLGLLERYMQGGVQTTARSHPGDILPRKSEWYVEITVR